MQTSTKDQKEENPMNRLHYGVTFNIPDHWGAGHPDTPTYDALQTAMLKALTKCVAELVPTTDSTWRVIIQEPPNEAQFTYEPEDTGGALTVPERRGGDVDRKREPIHIDARHSTFNEREGEKTKYARCGNCGSRYEITGDPIENHHRAQMHKAECGKGGAVYTDRQRRGLLEEFNEQPMQVAMREAAIAELEAGADPDLLKLTGVNPHGAYVQHVKRQQLIEGRAGISETPPPFIETTRHARRWWQFWRWSE